MFSSSPTSSPGSARRPPGRSTGPPRRTYARRRSKVAPERNGDLDSDSDDAAGADAGAAQKGLDNAEGKVVGRVTRGRAIAGTMSSPSLATSPSGTGARRLSQAQSSGSKSSPSIGRTRSSRLAALTTEQDGEGSGSPSRITAAELSSGLEGTEVVVKGTKRRASPSPSPPPSPSPSPRKQRAGVVPSLDRQRSTRPTRSREDPPGSTSSARTRDPATPPRSLPQLAPTTPSSSSPRDFAHLFAAVSPGRALQSSPGQNRTLGKSQSSGKVLDSPSKLRQRFGRIQDTDDTSSLSRPSTPKSSFGRTQSWPVSPSKSITKPDKEVELEADPSALWIKPVESDAPGSGGRAKRIYGRTRTVVADDEDTVSDVNKLEEALAKESYANLRSRYEVNGGEVDQGSNAVSTSILARAPQPVNDMRSKGENRRFMDETGYLLDGIEDPNATKGFRRSSCVDVLDNMQDEIWMSKMKICGQTERVWEAFHAVREDGDDAMNAVCLLALHFMIVRESGVEAILLSNTAECVRFVTDLLKERNGALDVHTTIKKTPLVERIRGIGQNTMVKDGAASTSTRGLASSILAWFSQDELSELVDASLIGERVLSKTLKAIMPEIKSLGERFELHESGLPLVPADGSINAAHLRHCLSVVDHLVIASPSDRDALSHNDEFSRTLLLALIASTAMALEETDADAVLDFKAGASIGIMTTLKVFANMSNVNSGWGVHLLSVEGSLSAVGRITIHRSAIAEHATRSDGQEGSDTGADELLCLCLAITTSAVLVDGELASKIASLKIDPTCRGQHACLRVCKCPAATPYAEALAQLYTSLYTSDGTASETKVMAAYVALLLAKIVTAVPEVVNSILSHLPGHDTSTKLSNMLQSLRELDGYRSTLHRGLKDLTGLQADDIQDGTNEVQGAMEDLGRLVDSY